MNIVRSLLFGALFCCAAGTAHSQNAAHNFARPEMPAFNEAAPAGQNTEALDLRKDSKLNELLGWNTMNGINGPIYVVKINQGYLYIGGRFTQINGTTVEGIARLNLSNNQWSALGTGSHPGVWGLDAGTNFVNAIEFSGNDVIIGGQFFNAGGSMIARRIAVWNSSNGNWSTLGHGFNNGAVLALTNYNGNLVAGGTFDSSATNALGCIAQWNGTSWTSVGGGVKQGNIRTAVMALAVKSSGSKTGLYAAGNFTAAGTGNLSAKYIAYFNGSSWNALGTGSNNGVGSGAGSATFASAIGIRGDEVFVGGNFTSIAGSAISNANRIARYNAANNTWYKLGNGVGSSTQTYSFSQLNNAATGPFVATIEFCDTVMNGSQKARYIYVGGFFQAIGNVTANNFARAEILNLNGTITWSPVESGVTNGSPVSVVWSFAKNGSSLYLGGQFGKVGTNQSTTHLARWFNLCTPPAVGNSNGGGVGGGWKQGESGEEATVDFELGQNHPNPFSGFSTINYTLSNPSRVTLTVFNQLGVHVMKLIDGEMPKGDHSVNIDGAALPNGLYYYRLENNSGSQTKQFVISR